MHAMADDELATLFSVCGPPPFRVLALIPPLGASAAVVVFGAVTIVSAEAAHLWRCRAVVATQQLDCSAVQVR